MAPTEGNPPLARSRGSAHAFSQRSEPSRKLVPVGVGARLAVGQAFQTDISKSQAGKPDLRKPPRCLPVFRISVLVLVFLVFLAGENLVAQTPTGSTDEPWLQPYSGPTRSDIDATTLDGKVLCGYQGWFNTPGDGTNFGFGHWGNRLDRPDGGRFTVDMWPDTSEYDPHDLCDVPGLKMPDGSPARLYSGFRKGPTLVHFKWMREYGIDGVFLSRFVSETTSPARRGTST